MVSAIEADSLYAGTMTVTGTVRTAPGARTRVSTPGTIGDVWTGASRGMGGLVTTPLRMSVRSAACHVRPGWQNRPYGWLGRIRGAPLPNCRGSADAPTESRDVER